MNTGKASQELPRNCPSCGERQPVKWVWGKDYCYHCSYPFFDEQKQKEYVREGKTESEISEILQNAKITGDWSNVPLLIVNREAAHMILTTSFLVAHREIENEIEVLTAECVFGMNIFKDFFAGVRDIVGGRSAATQKVLRDARQTALAELRREALMVGADAVIGIDLDYQELSGGGKGGMLMIVASGTAVSLNK